MIADIEIENYKSLKKISLSLGRVNVFVGENGAGKSNILEAIALAGAAAAKKLDNEFLASRGVRVSASGLMLSALPGTSRKKDISLKFRTVDDESAGIKLKVEGKNYPAWSAETDLHSLSVRDSDIKDHPFVLGAMDFAKDPGADKDLVVNELRKLAVKIEDAAKKLDRKEKVKIELFSDTNSLLERFIMNRAVEGAKILSELSRFIIYSPENTALRNPLAEGQILPLGINGEGLIKLVEVMLEENGKEVIAGLNKYLSLLGWFRGLRFSNKETISSESFVIEVLDKYIKRRGVGLDLKDTNEGFLFLLFYFVLFSSDLTPDFFAIDNIDASLNPKLCSALTKELCGLALQHEKQVILTTHNPATLDGLNLDDDEQRLFVISRDLDGCTQVRRIKKQKQNSNRPSPKLSEAFLRGALGGLPVNF